MTFWDWLASPIGIEAQHAVITLLLALAAYLSFLAHRQSKTNQQLLDGHLEQHMLNDILVSRVDDTRAEPAAPTAPPHTLP